MKCTSWEFDNNDNLGNTWTSEWNLVCDKEYLYVIDVYVELFRKDLDKVHRLIYTIYQMKFFVEYRKTVAEMFFLVGVATGGIISGYLSDKFGRKTMLFISVVLQTIFGE